MPETSGRDGETVELLNPQGAGAVLLLCEHASHHIPAAYRGLGLTADAARSHAAWDPGARDLAGYLSRRLDAPLVAGRVSRLVYDCNRPPEAASAMPERSEVFDIPGNRGLGDADRAARTESVYRPFCAAVATLVAQRKARGQPTVLVTVHSFTPVYHGRKRAVEIGILHDDDSRLADLMLARADAVPQRRIARNDPYGPQDGVTHSLRVHGLAHDLPNVMIEVRNDLLTTPEEIAAVGDELMALLAPAVAELAPQAAGGPDA